MEPIDLSPKPKLFVATDLIETAKELQTDLASRPLEEQPDFAVLAIDMLGNPRELYASKKVYLHALGAMVLTSNGELPFTDETIYHGTYFGDAYFSTNFSKFSYVQHPILQSICLQLAETKVLESKSNPGLKGARISSGVYVPVHSVESVLAA